MPASAATSVMEVSSMPCTRVSAATAARMWSRGCARCAAMVGAEILGMAPMVAWCTAADDGVRGRVRRRCRAMRPAAGVGARSGGRPIRGASGRGLAGEGVAEIAQYLDVALVGQPRLADDAFARRFVQLQRVQLRAVTGLEPGQAAQRGEVVEGGAAALVQAD